MDSETRVKLLDIAMTFVQQHAPDADVPRKLGLVRAFYRHLAATIGEAVTEGPRKADDKATEDALRAAPG